MPATKTAKKKSRPAAKKKAAPAGASMTCAQVMKELKALGTEQTRKLQRRHGGKEPFFGVKVGDMKPIQKRIKRDYQLALDLYATGNLDAQYLAGLIADDPKMTKTDLNKWARTANCPSIGTWAVAPVAAGSGHGFDLGMKWIDAKAEAMQLAGWATLTSCLSITPDGEVDIPALKKLLVRVAQEIHDAPDDVRYNMNSFVIAAGSFSAPLKEAALKAAKKIGTVEVDMGETSCKIPDATEYIQKVAKMGRTGKKKKSAKC